MCIRDRSEVKDIQATGEVVLSRVVIPEYVIVHDGAVSDNTAKNYYVCLLYTSKCV